jgi:hypothetical protein
VDWEYGLAWIYLPVPKLWLTLKGINGHAVQKLELRGLEFPSWRLGISEIQRFHLHFRGQFSQIMANFSAKVDMAKTPLDLK